MSSSIEAIDGNIHYVLPYTREPASLFTLVSRTNKSKTQMINTSKIKVKQVVTDIPNAVLHNALLCTTI